MTQRDKWAQRPAVMRYRAFADQLRACVAEQVGTLPEANQVERLDWVAYFRPAKSWSKKRKAEAIGELHRQKPDRDNIDKAILDVLFEDDKAIAAGTIEKRWAEVPRLEITIEVTG
jgi:Holliday junction resolvase RusA-like endonuclease